MKIHAYTANIWKKVDFSATMAKCLISIVVTGESKRMASSAKRDFHAKQNCELTF